MNRKAIQLLIVMAYGVVLHWITPPEMPRTILAFLVIAGFLWTRPVPGLSAKNRSLSKYFWISIAIFLICVFILVYRIPGHRKGPHESLANTFLSAVSRGDMATANQSLCKASNPVVLSPDYVKRWTGEYGIHQWRLIGKDRKQVDGAWMTVLKYGIKDRDGKWRVVNLVYRFDLLGEGSCIQKVY